ncbi:hypothetical protein [Cohnella panacarvi]|uniref:hypothetical protein n=1 Tax=Cohnella panacarvi TaxID=400776 RepID=UPI0012EC71E5|nr:hypothetical protein [Cohnella panacarvi]
MVKKSFSILNIIAVLVTSMAVLLSVPAEKADAATPTIKEKVNFTYSESSNDDKTSVPDFIFSPNSSKSASINISAKSGKVIKSLAWYTKGDTTSPIRSVPGAWLDKPSFSGSDITFGTIATLKASGGSPYGGVYYWNRSSGTDEWKSSYEEVRFPSSNNSACPPAPKDKWGYKAYPNCTDDRLQLTLTKDGKYTFPSDFSIAALKKKIYCR